MNRRRSRSGGTGVGIIDVRGCVGSDSVVFFAAVWTKVVSCLKSCWGCSGSWVWIGRRFSLDIGALLDVFG